MTPELTIEILGRIKQSQALTRFFQIRRAEALWNDDLEKLTMEMLLLRASAKVAKNFVRADSYRVILEMCGLDMAELDLEMHPPRDPMGKHRLAAQNNLVGK